MGSSFPIPSTSKNEISMTTLIIGGTGKTGLKLAHLLHAAGHPVLLTSRSGTAPAPFKATPFNWFDQGTFANPFAAEVNITKVFIVGPQGLDTLPLVQPFIELAVAKGVKLFVVLGASLAPRGGPFMGKVHQYLVDSGVKHCVLRPTSFMENFSGLLLPSIRDKSEIFSPVGDAKLPFIATSDIAQAAFDILTKNAENPPSELIIYGPDYYSFEEVAELLTDVLGRKITYKRLSEAESVKVWEVIGVPQVYAAALVSAMVAELSGTGAEEASVGRPFVGKTHLRDFFLENRDTWIAKD